MMDLLDIHNIAAKSPLGFLQFVESAENGDKVSFLEDGIEFLPGVDRDDGH